MKKFEEFNAESSIAFIDEIDKNKIYLVGAIGVVYVGPTDFRGAGFYVSDMPEKLGVEEGLECWFAPYDYAARDPKAAAIAHVIGSCAARNMEMAQAIVSALNVRGSEVIVTPKDVRREYDRIAGENAFLVDIAAHPLEVAGML
tara:strand:+ start:2708 stop:3139 length:432 start_codon:yes stop_codon:yes gene_type:complete